MSPYASLFGPRRMKANPSESEAIRDPLGRDRHLWDQEEDEPDLNGQLEAARADWRGDASLHSLFGPGGAFTLEDTVGKNGKNRPGDVFKVQSLLHREGLLDADKTDGPTGFLGIYDHEAIEKFQKENGLKQDGRLGPKGETIKAFETIYQPAGIRPQPQPQQKPQLGWKDYSLNLIDPKTWTIWDRMDERERNFYEQQAARQGQPHTETLSGSAGEDDATPVQLAQQDSPAPNTKSAPQSFSSKPLPDFDWSRYPGGRISGRFLLRTEENMPAEKQAEFSDRIPEWNAYEEAVEGAIIRSRDPKVPDRKATANEAFAIMQTHAYEGGLKKDPSSSAYGGILQGILDEAKASGTIDGLDNVKTPSDLTPTQHAAVTHYYLNEALGRVEGGKVLQDLPNKHVAAALADTVVRFGKNGGADIIRDAIKNRMIEKELSIPDYYKDAYGRLGPAALKDLRTLLKDDAEIGRFLEKLQAQRNKKVEGTKHEAGENNRNLHFRYEELYP